MTLKESFSKDNKKIVIPIGDPAGIGIEVILKALYSKKFVEEVKPLLVGCQKNIEIVYQSLRSKGLEEIADPRNLEIRNLPFKGKLQEGHSTKETGTASFEWLTHATELVLEKKAKALVTAPIAKYAWHQAGFQYAGQTERLAEMASIKNPSMLFTAVSPTNGWRFNTLLATTHIPFTKISTQLTPQVVEKKLNALIIFCKKFKGNPLVAVAGLNPHAGEEGNIGLEEVEWLKPLIKNIQKANPNIRVIGPLPPDTCWLSAQKAWNKTPEKDTPDGILALYHDQGLIPMKLIAFDQAVNTTLGLPFIRTSPDHGTAFDIAGKGCASPQSMIAAIETAWELINQ